MEILNWWVAYQRMKVDWRYVLIKDGALSMEMDGHILTLKWPADNLDSLLQVYVACGQIPSSWL